MPIQTLCATLALLQNQNLGWTGGTFLQPLQPVIFLPPEDGPSNQGLEDGEKTRRFLEFLQGQPTFFPSARHFSYGGSSHHIEEAAIWYYGFVGFFDARRAPSLRAVVTPFFVIDDDLFLVKSAAEFLELCCGDRVTAAPL